MKNSSLLVLAASISLTALSGCGGGSSPLSTDKSGTFTGSPLSMGSGQARSFVTLDASGNPTAIGLKFGAGLLNNLPAAASTQGRSAAHSDGTTHLETPVSSLTLPLPSQFGKTPVQAISMDWEPGGHPPAGIYNTPHFDLHFYLNSAQERAAITPGSNSGTPAPAPGVLPAQYVSTVDTVPGQGVHWVDPTGPEFNPPKLFSQAYIYGVDKGQLAFIEPMVSKAFLDSKQPFSAAIKQPGVFQKSGYYPSSYSVKFDAAKAEYTIALEGLTLR